jgi:hypothetical protein
MYSSIGSFYNMIYCLPSREANTRPLNQLIPKDNLHLQLIAVLTPSALCFGI